MVLYWIYRWRYYWHTPVDLRMITRYQIIIGAAIIVAFVTGGGTGYYAHDCSDQEPVTVKLEHGDVPVEVTCKCECQNDPCEVNIEQLSPTLGPVCPPPLKFEVVPSKWSIGAYAGENIFSGQFGYQVSPRWEVGLEAVAITDFLAYEKTYWYPQEQTDYRALIGVRYSGKPKQRLVSERD